MGCGSSTQTLEVEDPGQPGTAKTRGKTRNTKRAREAAAREAKKAEAAREERARSLAGSLMKTHQGDDALKVWDEYDDSNAKVLGSGMSGQVSTVKHRRTGVTYALKTLNIHAMGVAGLEELRREINAMRRLDHPNIVKIFEIYEDRDEIHMILELCTGGELVARIMEKPHGITEREAARHLITMLSALSHCHENAIVHRDVKLDNFVYVDPREDAELKLIDFGLSHLGKQREEISATGRVGTLSYMAPEVLRKQPYAKPCDMWSLGVVCFILLSGRRPFHAREREEKIDLILHTEPSYTGSGWKGISSQAMNFVQALLRKEPSERLTAQQALNHPWLVAGAQSATFSHLLSF